MKNLGILSLFFLLLFSSCRKDIDMVTVTENIPNPEIIEGYQPLIQIINGDLIGQVVGLEGEPISDAVVEMGTNNTSTDIYGHFFFNDVNMNSKGQYITIKKDGYFLGSRRFFPQAEATSRVKVEMLTKVFSDSYDYNSLDTLVIGNLLLGFPENGIVDENGADYEGTVYVASQWLDPTTKRVYDQMPGNLQGVNTDIEEVALKTLGMVAVELQGENGEKLNIKEGESAGFVYNIPEGLIENAPEEIPLWSFNEGMGIWVEDGVAILSADGTKYSGAFTHFSFWNWDIPAGNVYFSATFKDQNGNPIQNVLVTLTSTNYGAGSGYTDNQGYVSGTIPAGEVLTIDVWTSFQCVTSFYSAEIGPFDTDADLGTIVLTDDSINATFVTGILMSCDSIVVTNGLISINLDGYTHYNYVENGAFSFYLNNCTQFEEASLTAYDFDALISSNPINLVANTENFLDVITICENSISENILTFTTVDGGWSYPIVASLSDNGLFVNVLDQDSIEISFFVSANEAMVGIVESGGQIFSFANLNENPEWDYYLQNPNQAFFEILEITELGDFVSGDFRLIMSSSPDSTDAIEVNGTFNALLQ